jgi:hypothetical protein
LLEAVAVAVHLQDVNMMSKPVQQCADEPFVSLRAKPSFSWRLEGD